MKVKKPFKFKNFLKQSYFKKPNTLKVVNFRKISFRMDLFSRMEVGHISRGFIFVGGEILIITCGLIVDVGRYVIFISRLFLRKYY